MEEYGKHYSVLKDEILDLYKSHLDMTKELSFADLTFGAGGHACAVLKEFPNSMLVGFDQDAEAVANGNKLLEKEALNDRAKIIKSNFRNFKESLSEDIFFDAVLLDAGVSSHQFDSKERGFSFRYDAPLDMRMNNDSNQADARYYVNELEEEKIIEVLRLYGEEKFAKNIAKNIVERRSESPINTTKELEDICFHSYPKKMRFAKIHPATKTFQAFRILVNEELDVLTEVIDQVIPRLKMGGLFGVISFHSLEDRIIKHGFKNLKNGDYPVEILTKKPIIPSENEIFENSRSRSAKLRVVKRVAAWPVKNKYKNTK